MDTAERPPALDDELALPDEKPLLAPLELAPLELAPLEPPPELPEAVDEERDWEAITIATAKNSTTASDTTQRRMVLTRRRRACTRRKAAAPRSLRPAPADGGRAELLGDVSGIA